MCLFFNGISPGIVQSTFKNTLAIHCFVSVISQDNAADQLHAWVKKGLRMKLQVQFYISSVRNYKFSFIGCISSILISLCQSKAAELSDTF